MERYNLGFAEFADSVRATGAVNRLPQIGRTTEALSYSVYLDGPGAEALGPNTPREYHYEDAEVHAMTERLGLRSVSFRDNVKVAELLALRTAWRKDVLAASVQRGDDNIPRGLSEQVEVDYDDVFRLKHPWMQEHLEEQRRLSNSLGPVLNAAELMAKRPVVERVPQSINQGVILAQNLDFTVQAVDGEGVVAHENSKLAKVPKIGEDVTVAYYRGFGQVFENVPELTVSEPFYNDKAKALAVYVKGSSAEQVVLFDNVAAFETFVDAHKLAHDEMMKVALQVQAAAPREVPMAGPPVKVLSDVGIDEKTGALCVDVGMRGAEHRLLFSSVDEVQAFALREKVDLGIVRQAKEIADRSVAVTEAKRLVGDDIISVDLMGGSYRGRFVASTELFAVQNLGKRRSAIHEKDRLNERVDVGQMADIKYRDGRGLIGGREAAQVRGGAER